MRACQQGTGKKVGVYVMAPSGGSAVLLEIVIYERNADGRTHVPAQRSTSVHLTADFACEVGEALIREADKCKRTPSWADDGTQVAEHADTKLGDLVALSHATQKKKGGA